jgi:hypothetical protein
MQRVSSADAFELRQYLFFCTSKAKQNEHLDMRHTAA